MSSGDLLRVQIDQRDGWVWTEQMREEHWCGLVGKFVAESGSYFDSLGKPLEVEMHTEQSGSGLWVIALTSRYL